jgi:DNA-binding NarL/FixJ family response regulator
VSDNDAVKVLVVDDHAAVRAAIANLIDTEHPRLRVVGTAASADEALDQAASQQPHVVVLDANLGTEDGLTLIPALRRAAPCKVVVLSSLADPQLAAHANRLGAHACLQKTAPAAELLDCIATIHGMRGATVDTSNPQNISEGKTMHQGLHLVANALSQFVRSDDGVTAIEYGLLAALIAVAAIGAFSATGDSLNGIYEYWSSSVTAVVGS